MHNPNGLDSKPVIVITGAAGFVGTALRRLLGDLFSIVAVDLRIPASPEKGERWEKLDVTDYSDLKRLFQSIDRPLAGLVHLAWYYDFTNRPHPRYMAAVEGIRPLVEQFSRAALPDAPFIFSGSMAALAPTIPGVRQTADSPSAGGWQYPRSKVLAEQELQKIVIPQPRIELVLAAVYSDFAELVPLYQAIDRIRSGTFESFCFPGRTDRGLTYIHLNDTAEALLAAIRFCPAERNQVHRFLIGEAAPVTNQEIFDAVSRFFSRRRIPLMRLPAGIAGLGAQILGAFDSSRFIQPWMIPFAEEHFEFDLTATQKALGWSPRHRLSEELPKILRRAAENPIEWLRLNEQRPWRRSSSSQDD